MKVSGVHILVTYRCLFECDHCFVYGSPRQTETISLDQIEHVLQQAEELGTVREIYFEGGEPFLYYPLLHHAAALAFSLGFRVGLVSNAYWATSFEDARSWLAPFVGAVQMLEISHDRYHGDGPREAQVVNAQAAARELGIKSGIITIAEPGVGDNDEGPRGQIPPGSTPVRYRGRAAETLSDGVPHRSWTTFTSCPYEELRHPERVHVDPLGYVHVCQGITIGNVFRAPLASICQDYDPEHHPIVGPLLRGGPAALTEVLAAGGRRRITDEQGYADACHLCTVTRAALRAERPDLADVLGPDAVYGVFPPDPAARR